MTILCHFFTFKQTINVCKDCLTGVQPALEGEAAFLDIKREVVDVESACCDHLDGLVVAHQSVMCHIDVRYVWRLPHIYTARLETTVTTTTTTGFKGLKAGCFQLWRNNASDGVNSSRSYNSLMRMSGTHTFAVGMETCLTSSKSSGFQTRNSSVHD